MKSKAKSERKKRGGSSRAARGSVIERMFGKEHTKIEVNAEEPTVNLRWHRGVLQQLWDVTERHMHYMGDHYNNSTYHRVDKWRDVPGSPND